MRSCSWSRSSPDVDGNSALRYPSRPSAGIGVGCGDRAMRRIAVCFGMAAALVVGCRSTKVDPLKFAAIEVDEKGAAPIAPPKQGDVVRTFPVDRSKVAKSFFRN